MKKWEDFSPANLEGLFWKCWYIYVREEEKKRGDSLIVKDRKAHEGGRGAIVADFV